MDILDLFFKSNPRFATQHHIDSYNEFVDLTIKKVIASMNPFPVVKNNDNLEIYVGGPDSEEVFIKPVSVYPNICRINNLTYETDLFCNIHVYKNGKPHFVQKDVPLCTLPIMLHSNKCILNGLSKDQLIEAGECPYDKGGYFIVNGKEKVIISQDRNIDNKLFVSSPQNKTKYELQGYIKCVPEGTSVFPKTLWMYKTVPVTKNNNNWCIKIAIPHLDEPVDLFSAMRMLGIDTDKEIIEMIGSDYAPLLHQSIIESHQNGIFTQQQSLEYHAQLSKFQNVDNLLYVLFEDFLPNVPHSLAHKAKYLAYLVTKFLNVISQKDEIADRDNHINKRIGISGFLLGDIFKDFYNDFRVQTRSKIDNIYNVSNGNITLYTSVKYDFFAQSPKFKSGLIKSLKGNWGLLNDPTSQGIVQDLNRLSYMGFLSHMRRVNTPLSAAVKVRKPHQLDGSQWGIMCPCESPDGASIGLLRNLALLCSVSSSSDYTILIRYIKSFDVFNFSEFQYLNNSDNNRTKFILNNNWVACCSNANVLCLFIKLLKRNGLIDIRTSVTWNYRENYVSVHTDAGRCCRPLLVVQNGRMLRDGISGKYTWDDLTLGTAGDKNIIVQNDINKTIINLHNSAAVIEYLDVEESDNANIAMSQKEDLTYKTHVEIHPSTAFSIYTATIPFSNHNQAPRNIFSGAQGKQAIGIYATSFNNRIDTASYILHYPQKPLVSTTISKYFHCNELANGENVIVAIATYTGYNQEDSIIINKASIERGMFNITSYKSIVEKVSENISFGDPKQYNMRRQKYGNYAHIDEYGMPKINHKLELDDCVIGKISKNIVQNRDSEAIMNQATNIEYENLSMTTDRSLDGYTVDKVVFMDKENVKMRLRKMKIPELGDKACSRHGQKGVFGMVLPECDMPYTADGVHPDIIVNPHAFPSRMTIGHLLECVFAKVAALTGDVKTFTQFEVTPTEQFNKLSDYGLNKNGDEVMYNGISGEQIETEIFIGPTYYYRLKHMVSDKINYRSSGRVIGLTKQPPKGRSNGGGLRIGEMETNVLVSYGISAFTKESLMQRSDGTVVQHAESKLEMPHAYKLLTQELKAMSIETEWITDESEALKKDEFIEDVIDDDGGVNPLEEVD
jgi:DNA-directed RNA polymerase II subunit RPB2